MKVLPRSGLRKVEARGLFVEARAVRGRDWKWKDQDGEQIQHKELLLFAYSGCDLNPVQVVLVALVRWYQLRTGRMKLL